MSCEPHYFDYQKPIKLQRVLVDDRMSLEARQGTLAVFPSLNYDILVAVCSKCGYVKELETPPNKER